MHRRLKDLREKLREGIRLPGSRATSDIASAYRLPRGYSVVAVEVISAKGVDTAY